MLKWSEKYGVKGVTDEKIIRDKRIDMLLISDNYGRMSSGDGERVSGAGL